MKPLYRKHEVLESALQVMAEIVRDNPVYLPLYRRLLHESEQLSLDLIAFHDAKARSSNGVSGTVFKADQLASSVDENKPVHNKPQSQKRVSLWQKMFGS